MRKETGDKPRRPVRPLQVHGCAGRHLKGETRKAMSDSWRHRKATMQPQHSRMEMEILFMLHEKGLCPMTNEDFCIQSTIPDFWFPSRRLAVYLDGEKVHRKRQDKDAYLRELLAKRHGVKVLSITYKGNSKREKSRVLKLIVEATK